MTLTGTLIYGAGEARVAGILVAVRNGQPDPFAAAKTAMVNGGLNDGDQVMVTGPEGVVGTVTVIFMTNVQRVGFLTGLPGAPMSALPDDPGTPDGG